MHCVCLSFFVYWLKPLKNVTGFSYKMSRRLTIINVLLYSLGLVLSFVFFLMKTGSIYFLGLIYVTIYETHDFGQQFTRLKYRKKPADPTDKTPLPNPTLRTAEFIYSTPKFPPPNPKAWETARSSKFYKTLTGLKAIHISGEILFHRTGNAIEKTQLWGPTR